MNRQHKEIVQLKPHHPSPPTKIERTHYLSCRKEILATFSHILTKKGVSPQEKIILPSLDTAKKTFSNRATFLNVAEEDTPLLVSLTPSRALSLSIFTEKALSKMLKRKQTIRTRCAKEISSFYQHIVLSLFPLNLLPKSKTATTRTQRQPLWIFLSISLFLFAAIAWKKELEKQKAKRLSIQELSPLQILSLSKRPILLVGSPHWEEQTIHSLLILAKKFSENIGEVLLVEWEHQEISRQKRWTSSFSLRDFHTGKAMASFAWQTIRQQRANRQEDYFYPLEPQIYFLKGEPKEPKKGYYDPDPRIFAPFKMKVILFLLPASKQPLSTWLKGKNTLLWLKNNKWCTIYG